MSLLDKLKKNSTIKQTDILSESKFFNNKDMITTPIPALNIALSGTIQGGLTPGLTVFAGPSKHFKTLFSLILAKAYMDKYPDAVLLFYDSEFGTPKAYFESLKIDMDRVIHTPITDVEELKFDIMAQLKDIVRGDHLITVVDSVGNLASKKEVEDAIKQNTAADMTRAKQLKSLFRMVTPHLTIKDIPMIAVNHTYQTMELYSKAVVSGGTGIYYSADNIYIIGRQQEKDDKSKAVTGYNFIINVEKSRHTKEKSKIPVEVLFEGGLSKWSGLIDIAEGLGFVAKVRKKSMMYATIDQETGEIDEDNLMTLAQTNTSKFWNPILSDPAFQEAVRSKYAISHKEMMSDEDDLEQVFNNIDEE